MNFRQFSEKTLKDIEIKATELFDRNFEREGFFGTKWKPRRNGSDSGRAILTGRGRLRAGLHTPERRGNSLIWTFDAPYAKIHNEGGVIRATQNVRSFTRTVRGKQQKVRSFTRNVNTIIPQRQFIGDHPELRQAIEVIISRNMNKLMDDFKKNLKP